MADNTAVPLAAAKEHNEVDVKMEESAQTSSQVEWQAQESENDYIMESGLQPMSGFMTYDSIHQAPRPGMTTLLSC